MELLTDATENAFFCLTAPRKDIWVRLKQVNINWTQ